MANRTANEKNKPARKTLRHNEFYNPKTKRYEYRFRDALGKNRVVSSYRLEPTDQTPKGKRSGKSLREKEDEVKTLISDNVDIDGAKLTLIELVRMYLDSLYNKKNLGFHTKVSYDVVIRVLDEHTLGHMEIGKIRPEHCEAWLSDMKNKYRGASIQLHISVIKRALEYAVDYDYIAKNPFRRVSANKSDSKSMDAISFDDMERFLDFCTKDHKSQKYYDMIYVLFWTGLRASELCGLTLDNIDMKNNLIHVEKQLQCINHNHVVTKPKTINSIRVIPMTDGVKARLEHAIANRRLKNGVEPVCYDLNGKPYSGFVFLSTKSCNTMLRTYVSEYLRDCIKRYNDNNPEHRIRMFEPHICRHTFATNMQGLPIKTLQSVLGHSDIKTTMNRYVDAMPSELQREKMNEIANSLF